jgi:hypothetical protein
MKLLSEDQEIYVWESDVGNIDIGTFMDARVTFEQFVFAMGIDSDPKAVERLRKECVKMMKDFEEELKEQIGVMISVRTTETGVEVTLASSV